MVIINIPSSNIYLILKCIIKEGNHHFHVQSFLLILDSMNYLQCAGPPCLIFYSCRVSFNKKKKEQEKNYTKFVIVFKFIYEKKKMYSKVMYLLNKKQPQPPSYIQMATDFKFNVPKIQQKVTNINFMMGEKSFSKQQKKT